MSKIQPTPSHSLTRGAAAARAINANRVVSPSVIAATVELEGEKPEIIARTGKYGILYLVRSAVAANRYYPVNRSNGQYTFACDERTAQRLIKRIEAWLLADIAA